MGSAVPVIGLGLQAVSSLGGGGGTQYSPDPRAKYQADLQALATAEQNATRQRELLQQQKDVANQLVDYERERQYWQVQNERELYQSQLENQYQQALYQSQVQRTALGTQQMAGDITSQLQRTTFDAGINAQQRNMQLQNFQNQAGFQYGQSNRAIQRADAQGQQSLNNANLDIQQGQLGMQQLANQGARTDLGLARGQLGLAEQNQALQGNIARQGFDTAQGQANVNQQQQLAQAELGRQSNMNQLLNTFFGNQEQANQFAARMGALGLGQGTQSANLNQDMNLDPRIAAQQQLMRSQYGNQVGNANLENEMATNNINNQRANFQNQQDLQGIQNQFNRAGLQQQEAGLDRQDYTNQLQQMGLDTQRLGNQFQTDSFMNQLYLQEVQDYMNRSLLPDLQYQMGTRDLDYERIAGLGQMDAQDMVRNQGYRQNMFGLDIADTAAHQNRASQRQIIDADVARQIASMDAAKRSGLVANDNQLAAQLAQLASGQYGLLSGIGAGLSSPVPSGGGGGFNLAGLAGTLGGLLQGAAQTGLLSSGGGSRGGTQYQLNPAYGSYGATPPFNPNAYPTNYNNFRVYQQPGAGVGGF